MKRARITAKRGLALILTCLALMVSSVFVCAADLNEIGYSGGSAVTPVNLTTTNGGLNGGDITPTKLDVTVPTSLPLAMADDGAVITATDAKIINRSYGAVRVKSVSITAACNWHLYPFGDKSTLANEKVDSNKLGFAIRIGGGAQFRTVNENDTQVLISAPSAGCYMTGSGDPNGNTALIDYAAIVTPLSDGVSDVTVANVVIVVEWDTVN